MSVYVAAKWEERLFARGLQDKLLEHGFVISHDWTREDDSVYEGTERDAYRHACAVADVQGAERCAAFVIIPHYLGVGSFVELGVALANRTPVIGYLPLELPHYHERMERWERNIFSYMCSLVDNINDLLARVRFAHEHQHGRRGIRADCRVRVPNGASE